MRRSSLNEGWELRPKQNKFAELIGGAEWTAVTLPHDALVGTDRDPSGEPATGFFTGGFWSYRRTLELPAEAAGSAVVLEFEGVYRDAIVTVNGSHAAHWANGYSLVTVPIDHLLRFGEPNEVVVDVRCGRDSRWYSGAGITRNVWLLQGDSLHLDAGGLDVRTPEVDDDGAIVTVDATVHNRGAATRTAIVRVELLDGSGGAVADASAPLTVFPATTQTARQRLLIREPHRWHPDDPHLHTCRVTVLDDGEVLDEDETTFGIRTIAVDPVRGLRINGKPVLLRGACVHHDNGPVGAAAIDRADGRRVELLQAAGFNALRSAHNPMSRAMLDACDRLGVLVMDEAFDMWTEPKTDDDYALRFAGAWRGDVASMVRKDRNHPSVIFYSVGNEVPEGSTSDGLQTARALADEVRRLDDTRLVTQAVSGFLVAGSALWEELAAHGSTVDEDTGINTALSSIAEFMDRAMTSDVITDRTTEAYAHLDVAGYNYMDLRFAADGERFPHRVIVSTESYPSDSIDREWRAVTDNAHVIGEFTWTGWDYLGEVGIGRVAYGEASNEVGMDAFHGAFPWIAAWCGDIDITGRRRPQSHYREVVFGLRTEPYLAVQPPEHHGKPFAHRSPWAFDELVESWDWPDHDGAPITVDVFADADQVELLLDGESLGTEPAGAEQRFRARFETTYRPGRLEAVARRDGKELGRAALGTPTGDVRVTAEADRTSVAAGTTDLAFVALALVDADGTPWTSADRRIEVEVAGAGVLQGLASADPAPAPEEPFSGRTCTTFRGRALAVVRPTGAGTITVTATAEGGRKATVEITAG